MIFINCPICGHQLIEGEDVGIAIIQCVKCENIMSVKIKKKDIRIKICDKQDELQSIKIHVV